MTKEASYTPALGYERLTPLYDFAVALLTRERLWRGMLVAQVSPNSRDRILDVGCGTGTLAIRLKTETSAADVVALDPDPSVILRAQRKALRENLEIDWRVGFLDEQTSESLGAFTKVVSSLVLHQTPMQEKRRILQLARSLLSAGGTLHIADYGHQRSRLMRTLFRNTVQRIDGIGDTQPNADGVLPDLMKSAGFTDVRETGQVNTLTGSISVYQAKADIETNQYPPEE